MKAISAICLICVALLGATARGQQILVLGPGSTAGGDYLRGEGIAAWGMGQYNVNTAVANRIDAGTMILLNEYLAACIRAENARHARIRAQNRANHLKYFHQHRDQLRFAPERVDILNGNALNDLMEFLSQGRFTASVLDATPVELPVNLVRQIPFRLGEKGQMISLPRMMHRGNSWPVAFQDKKFTKVKQRYDRAINNALDESFKASIQASTIKDVRNAIEEVASQLKTIESTLGDSAAFKEAVAHVEELRKFGSQLEIKKVQEALIALDGYSGTTVQDLRKLMHDHGLAFASAENPGEKKAFREVYPLLKLQGEGLGAYQKGEK